MLPAGPSHVPAEQRELEVHHPQPVDLAQAVQSFCAAQLPQRCAEPNCHAAHVRPVGPADVPDQHALLAGHQPHPACAAQSEQME